MKGPGRIYTTGEAAVLCGISQQTVIRVFDSGRLKGFRVPGSKFRRIPHLSLLAFALESGIPTDGILAQAEAEAALATTVEKAQREIVEARVRLTTTDRLGGVM